MKTRNNNHLKKCSHEYQLFSNATNETYAFCSNCSVMVLFTKQFEQFLLKPITMQKKCEIDPHVIISIMKHSKQYQDNTRAVSLWYLKHRKTAVSYLQKLCFNLKYSDATFYLALTYLDLYCKYKEEEYNTKRMEVLIIGCFLLATKFGENDIFAPSLDQFESFNRQHMYNSSELLQSELCVLKKLDYELIQFSSYDWLFLLLNNGFVFEDEVFDKPSDYINRIYVYSKKTLAMLTLTDVFLNYSSFMIAFAIIELTRRNFNLNSSEFQYVRDWYHIDDNASYEKCLSEVQR